jgi:hypothetical protein
MLRDFPVPRWQLSRRSLILLVSPAETFCGRRRLRDRPHSRLRWKGRAPCCDRHAVSADPIELRNMIAKLLQTPGPRLTDLGRSFEKPTLKPSWAGIITRPTAPRFQLGCGE